MKRAAARDGVNWRRHFDHAEQVIVFGSHAIGVQTPKSDIDLLCIGRGRSCATRLLQILWLSPSRFNEHVRRGSELACHVAAFGVWVKGRRRLPLHIVPSADTIARRQKKIAARCSALSDNWSALAPTFRSKHLCKVRRDLQRLQLLRQGEPNLPAPVLDRQWLAIRNRSSVVRQWIAADEDLQRMLPPTVLRSLQKQCQRSYFSAW